MTPPDGVPQEASSGGTPQMCAIRVLHRPNHRTQPTPPTTPTRALLGFWLDQRTQWGPLGAPTATPGYRGVYTPRYPVYMHPPRGTRTTGTPPHWVPGGTTPGTQCVYATTTTGVVHRRGTTPVLVVVLHTHPPGYRGGGGYHHYHGTQ